MKIITNKKFIFAFICILVAILSLCLTLPVVGVINDDNSLTYNDVRYNPIYTADILEFKVGKCLGKLNNNSKVYAVEGDNACNYICTLQWDGKILYQKENANIPRKNKTVTQIFTSYDKFITNTDDVAVIVSLDHYTGDAYSYRSDGHGCITFYGCYDCPIATLWIGSVTYIDEKWVFVSDEAISESFKLYGSGNPNRMLTGIVITDDEIINVLDKYY